MKRSARRISPSSKAERPSVFCALLETWAQRSSERVGVWVSLSSLRDQASRASSQMRSLPGAASRRASLARLRGSSGRLAPSAPLARRRGVSSALLSVEEKKASRWSHSRRKRRGRRATQRPSGESRRGESGRPPPARTGSSSLSETLCQGEATSAPPGLLNLGRTCSFNALLQALAATRTFSTLYGGNCLCPPPRRGTTSSLVPPSLLDPTLA